MKRWPRILTFVLAVAVLMVVAGVGIVLGPRPFLGPRVRPLTSKTFERTPARLARGEYLARAVTGCLDCHSPHDWTQHDAPTLAGMEGSGQDFSLLKGLPGHVVAPNLTPDTETGAGSWSDDMWARAIREGIGHDGRTLFPFMPYQRFSKLSDEDLASIVVYMRSLPPVKNSVPKTEIIFPVKYLIRSAPQPIIEPVAEPDLSTPAKRGEYLANAANCADCHTPQDRGAPLPGKDFAGGLVLEGPWGRVASANLTPDATGISYYDPAMFVNAIRTGYVGARKLSQVMPWSSYRNMTDEDLHAIFAYLQTLKPVHHAIDNSEPLTYCPADKSWHGAGERNNSGSAANVAK